MCYKCTHTFLADPQQNVNFLSSSVSARGPANTKSHY